MTTRRFKIEQKVVVDLISSRSHTAFYIFFRDLRFALATTAPGFIEDGLQVRFMVKVGLGQVLGPGSKLKIHLLWEMTLTFFFSNLRFVVATTVPGFIRDFGGECFISSVFIIIIIMVIALHQRYIPRVQVMVGLHVRFSTWSRVKVHNSLSVGNDHRAVVVGAQVT